MEIQTCDEHLGDLPGAHKEIMIFHQKKGKKWCMLNEGFKALSVKTTSKSYNKSSYEWNKKKRGAGFSYLDFDSLFD